MRKLGHGGLVRPAKLEEVVLIVSKLGSSCIFDVLNALSKAEYCDASKTDNQF